MVEKLWEYETTPTTVMGMVVTTAKNISSFARKLEFIRTNGFKRARFTFPQAGSVQGNLALTRQKYTIVVLFSGISLVILKKIAGKSKENEPAINK